MPATVIKTIKASGGDYTNLSSWASDRKGNLTTSGTTTSTDGRIEKAEIYDQDLSDTLTMPATGWTTAATNYVWLFVVTEGRHDGRSRDTSGQGFRMRSATNVVTLSPGLHIIMEGMEIVCTTTNDAARGAVRTQATATGQGDIRLYECILENRNDLGIAVNMATTPTSKGSLRNCIVLSGGTTGVGVAAATQWRLDHCTILNIGSTSTTTTEGLTFGAATTSLTQLWNSYVGNFNTDISATGLATARGGYNASRDTTATLRFGTTSISSLSATANMRNYIATGKTVGSLTRDLHLSSSATLRERGSSTTTATIDIDGTERS